MSKKIAVLMGGLSSEREVSLESGEAVVTCLKELGHDAIPIDVGADIAEQLQINKPDVVFNALHGTYGEDGCVQGLLECLKIPYTHSGVLSSAMAMDKPTAKKIFELESILCPEDEVMKFSDLKKLNFSVSTPFVVKPVADGSSVDVYIVNDEKDFPIEQIKANDDDLFMVEKYIPGKELSVAVLDGKPLGVIEIRPKDGFYDYKNKYTKEMTEYIMPAEVSEEIANEAMRLAVKAHESLGCRGVTRSDFRYDDTASGDGKVYMLEINTHPGMTPLSLTPKIASYIGVSFSDIVESLIKSACCEKG